MEVIAFGKIKSATHGRLVIDHPEYEILSADSDDAAIHIDRITPIYRAPNGIPQKTLRRAAFLLLAAPTFIPALARLDPDWLLENIRQLLPATATVPAPCFWSRLPPAIAAALQRRLAE